jgi:hypothetical protein
MIYNKKTFILGFEIVFNKLGQTRVRHSLKFYSHINFYRYLY